MNAKEYTDLKGKYARKVCGWGELLRIYAFMEFDAALEEYDGNEKSSWNDGAELMDVSPADVECVIDEFLARWDGRIMPLAADEMRNAIQAVTGLIC